MEREFSVVGFSFTYVQKIFSGSLKAWVETIRTNAARRRRKPRPRRSALRRPVYESSCWTSKAVRETSRSLRHAAGR